MFRQIVIPQNTELLLHLPQEFVGQQVEVIAFTTGKERTLPEKEVQAKQIEKIFDRFRTDLSKFKFNREEANDYD